MIDAIAFKFQTGTQWVHLPEKYGNWVDIAWVILGLVLMIWLLATRREKLEDMERVYVDDEPVAPDAPPAVEPA